jgi:hypothetical protein
MQKANERGCYGAETTEELARCGRSYAAVKFCQCDDGRYRYALDMQYSYGGFCGPIFASGKGYTSSRAATDAAMRELLRRFPKTWASEPQSVHDELRELKAQIETAFQPADIVLGGGARSGNRAAVVRRA